ncbi:SCO family protein [Paraburkholderia atlantica]|uniref:Electron transport protein SCO1/SenC n=1 Tax=Paraburkholderia atlantica TaxID=2654982 RepID=D5WNP0_PARAM|nr:SCO family protein [Paraburkholderia atlantica]ADG20919.1 electron transport protein SCO1/SenC [Paraburkholderia atlantica]MBB5511086.1 protein SCO1/2 [Paraburkholderia atlantica]
MSKLPTDRRLSIVRGVLSVVLALALVACDDHAGSPSTPPGFVSGDITGVGWGRDFHLIDHNGKPRSLADFRGKVVMLFFGYTHCPDQCPTTMAEIAEVRGKLGENGRQVQGLFVTVDPARDTPQVLAQYVSAFAPTFLGLYGDERTTSALAREFKFYYSAQKADAHGNYSVDHGSAIYVFDPTGRLRLLMNPEMSIDAMAADVGRLLKE